MRGARGLGQCFHLVLAMSACTGEPRASAPPRTVAPPQRPPLARATPAAEVRPARLRAEPGLLVAHALGSIGDVTYTNSLEAFDCNYQRGYRWFEVDLSLTADDVVVCFHPGQEQVFELPKLIDQLPFAEVEGKKIFGKYPLRRLTELLERADQLGDVVLVTDTKHWSERMLAAMKRTILDGRQHATRIVLQSYGESDIAAVKQLSREIGGEVILTLYMTNAEDESIARLAKQYDVVAVVADPRRFSPWLAQRLHAVGVPILVHTINQHKDILTLAGAGADGFYTDDYRPYDANANAPQGTRCDARGVSASDVTPWLERGLLQAGDYLMKPCAVRRGDHIELAGCDASASIWGPYLSVPPARSADIELEAAAGADAADFWLEFWQKGNVPLRARETLRLGARERKAFTYRLDLPKGSSGIELRLGLGSERQRLLVYQLKVRLAPASSDADSALGASLRAGPR